jgi:hypothetical protein
MNRRLIAALIGAATAAAAPVVGQDKAGIPKTAPADGEVPYGKVMYVDDGKCPAGEIREITGGSKAKSIPRTSRCVKHPGSPK